MAIIVGVRGVGEAENPASCVVYEPTLDGNKNVQLNLGQDAADNGGVAPFTAVAVNGFQGVTLTATPEYIEDGIWGRNWSWGGAGNSPLCAVVTQSGAYRFPVADVSTSNGIADDDNVGKAVYLQDDGTLGLSAASLEEPFGWIIANANGNSAEDCLVRIGG